MSEENKGWRAVPPALVVALATWIGFMVFRLAYILGKSEIDWSPGLGLASDGVSMASYSLALLGTLELARRSTGRLSLAAKIAAGGFALGLLIELGTTMMHLDLHLWEKKWLRDLTQYGYMVSWMMVGGAFAWAAWPRNRALAIAGIVLVVLADLPPFIATPIFEGIKNYKIAFALDSSLRLLQLVMVLVLAIVVGGGVTPTDRQAGADGLRLAARGMWLRVIVAISIVLMTLMAMSSARSGGEGTFKMLRFIIMAGACATVVAFAMFGLGVARTARATIANLPRLPLAVSAACSMWCCGVEFAKLPFIYHMLYQRDGYGGRSDTDYVTTFATVEPLVAIAAVAFVAIAIGKFASERTTIALQSEAQGKGIGIISMMLAAVAIQQWLIPKVAEKSHSPQSTIMVLMLLSAVAGLIAVVMIARLCANAADEINREPGLPTASVVPPG